MISLFLNLRRISSFASFRNGSCSGSILYTVWPHARPTSRADGRAQYAVTKTCQRMLSANLNGAGHPSSLRSAHVEPPDERLKHLTGTSDAKPLPSATAPRCRAPASAPRILSASVTESLPGLNAPCATSIASPKIRTPFVAYLARHLIAPAIYQACPACFPITEAPVVRNHRGRARTDQDALGHAAAARVWAARRSPTSAIPSSPHWRGWLKPENRCLVPAQQLSPNMRPSRIPRPSKKDVVWFALNDDRPLFAFAGIWTPVQR